MPQRVSVGAGAVQSNAASTQYAISTDGRYVAFQSVASNLVPADTNSSWDIFVRDRGAGTTTRVSVGPSGAQANSGSYYPQVSADGRVIAFSSLATNLLAGGADSNGQEDVFVHDASTGVTTRVSVGPMGEQANGTSYPTGISSDGRFVLFLSNATNLLGAGSDTNGSWDAFVHDRQSGSTARVSVGSAGLQANSDSRQATLSSDGRFVVFQSSSTNLGSTSSDTNGALDVFLHDRQTATTERVSLGVGGVQANSDSHTPSVSSDGRYVAFMSLATNLLGAGADTNNANDVFVRDRVTMTTVRLSVGPGGVEGNGNSAWPSISGDGRYVAFSTGASNFVAAGGDTNGASDVYVFDRVAALLTRLSVSSAGVPTDRPAYAPIVSSDGRYVAFTVDGSSTLLGPGGDTNGVEDVFVAKIP